MADHVVVGTGTKGTNITKHKYPVEEGLIAGTTKQTQDSALRPQEGSVAQGEIHGS